MQQGRAAVVARNEGSMATCFARRLPKDQALSRGSHARSLISGSSATTRSLIPTHTLLLNFCVKHFSTVLVHYFVVGMKQEESDRLLPVELTPLVHTLSPVLHTLPT